MTALGLLPPRDAASGAPRALVLVSAAASICGPRADNQDAGYAGPHLLAIADGVGGKVGGAVASATAIDALSGLVGDSADLPDGDLQGAVVGVNERLRMVTRRRPELTGMATTLTAVALTPGGRLAVAHIGDARAYLLRDGQLVQLTEDQTLVQGLVTAGVISYEQARTHPLRSVVLGALHGDDDDLAHLVVVNHEVRQGDRLLVCSDGLYGVVSPDTIRRVLAEESRPADAVTRLLRDALVAGTRDNATVVVADVDVLGVEPAALPTTVGARACEHGSSPTLET